MPFYVLLTEKKQINNSKYLLPSPQNNLYEQEIQLDNILINENIINYNQNYEQHKLYSTKINKNNEKKLQMTQADEEYLQDKQQLSDKFNKMIMQIEGVEYFTNLKINIQVLQT
jgi:hypothetical protein